MGDQEHTEEGAEAAPGEGRSVGHDEDRYAPDDAGEAQTADPADERDERDDASETAQRSD